MKSKCLTKAIPVAVVAQGCITKSCTTTPRGIDSVGSGNSGWGHDRGWGGFQGGAQPKTSPENFLHQIFHQKQKRSFVVAGRESSIFCCGIFGALVGRWLTFLPSAQPRRMVQAFLAVQSEMEAERAFGLASRHIAAWASVVWRISSMPSGQVFFLSINIGITYCHSLPIDLTTSRFGEMNYPVGSTSHQAQICSDVFFGANLCSEGSLRRWTTARHGDSSMRLALMQLFQNTTSASLQTNDLRQKGEKKPCNNQIILFGVCVSLLVALTQIRGFSSRWAITELRTSQNQFHVRLLSGSCHV